MGRICDILLQLKKILWLKLDFTGSLFAHARVICPIRRPDVNNISS